jgi:hypothetical protein
MTAQLMITAQAALFVFAATLHSGLLVHGYEHSRARTAESLIAIVLVGGLLLTAIIPRQLRPIAMGVQGFALLGTVVGLFTIAVGVGPRSVLDLSLHAVMVALLTAGLLLTRRTTVNT